MTSAGRLRPSPRAIEPESLQILEMRLGQFGKLVRPQEVEAEERAAHPGYFGSISHAVSNIDEINMGGHRVPLLNGNTRSLGGDTAYQAAQCILALVIDDLTAQHDAFARQSPAVVSRTGETSFGHGIAAGVASSGGNDRQSGLRNT